MVKRLLHPRVILPMLVGLIGGALLGPLQLSCGVVQSTACAAEECPAGPPGPQGPQGPGFGNCQWLISAPCAAGIGVECEQVCPAGTNPVSGACDAKGSATLSENRASTAPGAFPQTPTAPFTGFDRWVCETATGDMQFTYALCCKP